MRIKEFRTKYNDIYLYAIGDVHIGDKGFTKESEEKLKGYIDFIRKTPNAFCVLQGDVLNNATRLSKSSPFEQNMDLKEQIEKAVELFKPIKHKILGSINGNHSLDKNTDVLTKEGWKNIQTVSMEDQLAQFRLKDGKITYARPICLENHYENNVVEIEGRNTKQIVDAFHDVVVDNKKTKAFTLLNKELKDNNFRIYGNGNCKGINLSEDMLKLLTWVVCDGTIVNNSKYQPNSKKIRIQFKLSKERKIKSLKGLLNKLNIPFTYKLCKKTGINKLQPYYIRIYGDYSKEIYRLLKGIKQFPSEFRNLNKKQLLVVLSTLSITDGSKHYSKFQWTTINKNDVDIIQEACIKNELIFAYTLKNKKSGFKNGKQQYHCKYYNSLNNNKLNYSINVKLKKYNDKVYCVTMPLGTLVTRIDGKVAFTGNCLRMADFCGYSPMISICERLGIDYMGDSGVYLIRMGCHSNKGIPRATFTVYSHHTTGGNGRTIGSKINRVEVMRELVANADVYVGSHNHMLGAVPAVTQMINPISGKIEVVRQMLVDCGGYLEHNNTYAERMMLPPLKIGSPRIHLIIKRSDKGGKEETHRDVHVSL